MELDQLESCIAVESLHHREVRPDAVEPHDAIQPLAFGCPLALQLEPRSTKNRVAAARSSTTTPVVHPLDRHVLAGCGGLAVMSP
jgi:hypothetical protein